MRRCPLLAGKRRIPRYSHITVHGDISIEIDGKTYRGSYTVFSSHAPTITVVGYDDLLGATKTTQLGDSPPDVLARIMLGQLVEDKASGFDPYRPHG